MMHFALSLVLLSVLGRGVASAADQSSDKWTLTGYDFNQTSFSIQPYVANGYIGQRLPVAGFGFSQITPLGPQNGTNGWPLFDNRSTTAMVAGFYDQQPNTTGTNFAQTGGEQPISTLPTFSSLYLTVNGQTLQPDVSPDQISNFSQSMSIEHGVVQTSYVWAPASNSSIQVKYTALAHRTRPNLFILRLDVSGLDQDATITDMLDGEGALRTTPVSAGVLSSSELHNGIYSAVKPNGIDNVTAFEVSSVAFIHGSGNATNSSSDCFQPPVSPSTAHTCYSVSPQQGSISLVKYVGVASSDAFPSTERQTAIAAVQKAYDSGYDALLSEHKNAWSELWEESDIIIPGETDSLKQLQLATRASLFHLLANVRKGSEGHGLGDNSIAPAGLTSDSYAGQIFWDADTWMSYPLSALFPDYAESILNYRYRFLDAAKTNAQQFNLSGALFPWTGARFGNCTGVGPCYNYEYHLNNDIALAQIDFYFINQNTTWLKSKGYPVIEAVAEMWPSLVKFNSTTQQYEVTNGTDPDEYSNFVDSPAFTSAGIKVIEDDAITLGRDVLGYNVPASNWSQVGNNVQILSAPSGITLEYEGFNGSVEVKQADVVLLTWPLEYGQSRETGLQNLQYYAGRTSPSGPGMTYSIFSIDTQALNAPGCSGFTYMLAASQPYNRAPFYQFSEQTSDVYNENGGTNPAFTFLTAHGGFLQSLVYGFSGFRPRLHALYLDPSLPPQLPELYLKGVHFKDSLFDLNMTLSSTIITRRTGGSSKATVEIGGSRNSKAGNYSLGVGESLTVPTYVSNKLLLDGNVLQCQSIYNSTDVDFEASGEDDIVAAQYALAALDGNNATAWQPRTSENTSMIIKVDQPQAVQQLHMNFGERPPLSISMSAGQQPDALQTILPATAVNISAPAGSFDLNEVVNRVGNTTTLRLSSPVTASYFQLTIQGCHEDDGMAATVAEVALTA